MRPLIPRALLLALVLFCTSFICLAQEAAQKAARAQEILSQARAALGGEAGLKAIQSLAASGSFRGSLMGRAIEGSFKLDLLLPDKLMRTVQVSFGPLQITRTETINGDEAWMDLKRDAAIMGGLPGGNEGGGGLGGGPGGVGAGGPGGGGRGDRMGGGMGGPGMGGGSMNTVLSPEMRRELHDEFSRLLVSLLLTAPASGPFDFTWEGEVPGKENQKADVLMVRGPEDFIMGLYIDQTTHRPLMIRYRALMMAPPRSREEAEKSRSDSETREAKPVDMQLYFEDYREVSKIRLPHRIIKTTGGQVTEEWKLSKYKINPDLKAKKFEKKS
jgi:hypothetical protein